MSDYIEPSQDSFDNSEQVALDVLTTSYPKLLTKTGSVLRELLIRPLAYVYAWLSTNFEDKFNKSTIEYFKNSNATEDSAADALASNYFVTRKTGLHSKGAITLILNTSATQLDAGTAFSVDGIILIVQKKTICMGLSYEIRDDIQYVPVIPYSTTENTYMTTIPVIAEQEGALEIPAGTNVNMEFADSSIVSALLTSPVSGGKDIETDAELMARAEYNTANAGIGSYYGIKKKLAESPVSVLGMNIMAGEDIPLFRARYNTVGINPGGFVDCYVKTYKQYAADTIVITQEYSTATQEHTIRLHDDMHAGIFAVKSIRANGEAVTQYTVDFESSNEYVDAAGARLSINQVTVVKFSTLSAVTALSVGIDILYMPGIYDIQNYMDSSTSQFIGQSLMIKAAVPIVVSLACKLSYNGGVTEDIINNIKACIADYVNSVDVGVTSLNFSNIQKRVRDTYPEADVRLPCSMTGKLILKDGTAEGMYSVAGILDISYPVSTTEWSADVCYFSLISDNIRLELI